jgi:hypothetical protein
MKLLVGLLLLGLTAQAQHSLNPVIRTEFKWKIDRNKLWTGGLVFLAGASKGFNETLTFHWTSFHKKFSNADPHWFNPKVSWKNKYKDADPGKGARFPFSTSLLIMTTDQYHLNNFINRSAWTAAIIITIGEKKKSFKYYLKDFLYHTICQQIGFALAYYPFTDNPDGN